MRLPGISVGSASLSLPRIDALSGNIDHDAAIRALQGAKDLAREEYRWTSWGRCTCGLLYRAATDRHGIRDHGVLGAVPVCTSTDPVYVAALQAMVRANTFASRATTVKTVSDGTALLTARGVMDCYDRAIRMLARERDNRAAKEREQVLAEARRIVDNVAADEQRRIVEQAGREAVPA
jgi:hypothetical protein